MQTSFFGVRAFYNKKEFQTFKLDEHKGLFMIKSNDEEIYERPDDFMLREVMETEDELLIKLTEDLHCKDDPEDKLNEMEIVLKKNANLKPILEKLKKFGFKLNVRSVVPGQLATNMQNIPSAFNAPTSPNVLLTQSAKSGNSEFSKTQSFNDILQNGLIIDEYGYGTISLVKQDKMHFHPNHLLTTQTETEFDTKANQHINYNENLITDISVEFDVKLPKDSVKFKFPLLPEFKAATQYHFVFLQRHVELEFFKTDQVYFLSERINPLSTKEISADYDILKREIYLTDEKSCSVKQKISWTQKELDCLFDTFKQNIALLANNMYKPDQIELTYNKEVRKQFNDMRESISGSGSSSNFHRREIRINQLKTTWRLRTMCQGIAEHQMSLRVLEQFIETLIRVFDRVISELSSLVIRYFTYENKTFKLTKFTLYVMKLVSEEISELKASYIEIFNKALVRPGCAPSSQEARFLKEFWVVKNKNVFLDSILEDCLKDTIEGLVFEAAEMKFRKLTYVQSKFENLFLSFS